MNAAEEPLPYDKGGDWPRSAPWPGRPRIDVPGLEEPAHYWHAISTVDEPGQRALLVLATEDRAAAPTTEQLTALADGLDELHGDEAPEGSRAWLRAELAELRDLARSNQSERDTARRRAEQAEAALRERSDVTDQAGRIEQLTLEIVRTREALQERQGRVEALVIERDQLAREVTALAANGSRQRHTIRALQREVTDTEDRGEGDTALIEQLRHERDQARAALAEAGQALRELQPTSEVARLRDELGRLQAKARLHGDEVMGLRDQLRGHEAITAQVDALYGELDDAHALADETRDALIESVKHAARADHGERNARREAATQAARARTAVGGAAGALLTAAALAWRHRR